MEHIVSSVGFPLYEADWIAEYGLENAQEMLEEYTQKYGLG